MILADESFGFEPLLSILLLFVLRIRIGCVICPGIYGGQVQIRLDVHLTVAQCEGSISHRLTRQLKSHCNIMSAGYW